MTTFLTEFLAVDDIPILSTLSNVQLQQIQANVKTGGEPCSSISNPVINFGHLLPSGVLVVTEFNRNSETAGQAHPSTRGKKIHVTNVKDFSCAWPRIRN